MTIGLYSEPPEAGNAFRETMLKEVKALLRKERLKADRRRKRYFKPDLSSVESYEQSAVKYREQLREMLGWPLTGEQTTEVPSASELGQANAGERVRLGSGWRTKKCRENIRRRKIHTCVAAARWYC